MDNELIFSDHRISVLKAGDFLKLIYHVPHSITINIKDHTDKDNEIIRILRTRSEYDEKLFFQKDASKIFNISQQMINRRWKVYNNEGLYSLISINRKSKITPQLLDRLTQLYSENPFYTSEHIISKLINEGLCDNLTEGTIRNAQKMIDGSKFIKYLRQRGTRAIPEVFMDSGYLIEKLFKIMESF